VLKTLFNFCQRSFHKNKILKKKMKNILMRLSLEQKIHLFRLFQPFDFSQVPTTDG